jgi:M-phase phosphoprotein 6, animal type
LCCFRENNSSAEGSESASVNKKSYEVNGNGKRKQSEDNEAQYPNKSPNNDQGNKKSSPNNGLGSFKKPSGDKLDWNVLRSSSVKQNR